ncbi:hypothetical protein [Flavobacterium rhizosphaerae]|uniref:Uncharacterized protein n=1 Tax=Flavobacterium rhizosphaerae TaxID=3163298 RepID=A0ABW8YY19_9FLAO
MKDIRNKKMVVSDSAQVKLNQDWVTMDDITNTLTYGDVDFSLSNKPQKGGGKLYVIEGRNANNEDIIIHIINFTNKAELKDIVHP